ncbi:PREDICTED: disease resistance protein RPS6-like [Populus euphratica]|uniref:Disease resistance protein RPS6-like n=1 Tax=Populus euphratica TaxID=75702 RepID=A0AAJ6XDD3_POPEU|nr:PREDICTED: disease resistance protein RPS6-like [Populus euphratica]
MDRDGSSQEYKMHLPPTGLEHLRNELRYLRWHKFPSNSLPPYVRAEHLVELHLRKSKLEKLRTGVKDVGNLRRIDLSDSPYLTELLDLSMAKNLQCLRLAKCPSLTEVPSSLQYLDKLAEIYLEFSYNLRSFPMLYSQVLRKLTIWRCLDVTTCPTISQNMVRLELKRTLIKEVLQSVAGTLEYLYVNGCSKMTKFPQNLEDIVELNLRVTAIKEVPSSIQFLTRLRDLDMSGCAKLESFLEITVPIKSLGILDLSKTGIKELPLSIKDMVRLQYQYLHGTPIKELPLSIKDMVCLQHLTFHGTAIKALPELPSSLTLGFQRDFTNCFKLDQKPLVAAMHLKIQSGEEIPHGIIQMVLPGSEIQEWFGDKGIGSSLTIQLPSNCLQLKGIAFCLIFLLPPRTCLMKSMMLMIIYILITMLRVKTVSMMVMMKSS